MPVADTAFKAFTRMGLHSVPRPPKKTCRQRPPAKVWAWPSPLSRQKQVTAIDGNGDGAPVCDQPNQEWCIGRPNDRTCGPTKGIGIRIRIFTNEVQILEREKNLKSIVISTYPIRRETCNPTGVGFRRIVEYSEVLKCRVHGHWLYFT